jgi:hypothetical protein
MAEFARGQKARSSGAEEAARAPRTAVELRHGLAALHASAGNRALSRLIQRKDLGKGRGGMQWMSSGNFDGKHLLAESPTAESAKARYEARYNKGANVPAGNQVNTVVGEPDLKSVMADASKVVGAYPQARGPRGKLTITVPGKKVFGKKVGNKQVPDRVKDVSTLTIEGISTESTYQPDHVAG